MELSALSNAELVDLARGGSAPAFAVLLHRHGGAVRAVVAGDKDPTGAVIGTFVAAMRELDRAPAGEGEVTAWLLALAADQVKRPAPVGPDEPDLDPDELDEVWAELDLRWPRGRAHRHVPAWLGWTALVIALVALGVLVPYAALSWNTADDEWDVLRAEPFEDEGLTREEAPELVEEALDEDIEFELPPLDFDEPEAGPDPEAAPEPPPAAQPDPEPETQPAATEEADEADETDEVVEEQQQDDADGEEEQEEATDEEDDGATDEDPENGDEDENGDDPPGPDGE